MKVIIVGGGQVGTYLASMLLSGGHEVRLVEYKKSVVEKLAGQFPEGVVMYGSGTDPKILEKVGIDDAPVIASVTGEDQTNLVISTLAKMEYAVPKVVARVNKPKNAWLFNSSMGVDVGVNQADLLAHFVVEEMNMKDMMTLMKLNRGDYSIIQLKVHPQSSAANQMVMNISIPKRTVLIALTRQDEVLIPKGDTVICADDDILALADETGREELSHIFG